MSMRPSGCWPKRGGLIASARSCRGRSVYFPV